MNADSRKAATNDRILGRVNRAQFVGRAAELQQIVSHPFDANTLGLLVLLAPSAGVSELLRQAYDELFYRRGTIIPIYFALPREQITSVSAGIEFLNQFLLQYLAFRRAEPELCQAMLTLDDLLQLAPPADHQWIAQLVETYKQERFGSDDRALIQWCLAAPQRVPASHGQAFVMLDAVPLTETPNNGPALGPEMIRVFRRSRLPYTIAGLRRQMLQAAHAAQCDFDLMKIIRLDRLTDEDGRMLIDQVARRQGVQMVDETRDLLVQQFEASPLFITTFIQAARENDLPLTTYLACEQLYVDDLMGGRINQYHSELLEEIAPDPELRRRLIQMLFESSFSSGRKASFETWKRNLRLETDELESVLRALHIQEFITLNGSYVDAGGGSVVWKDFLKTRYRLEAAAEPRALVVAETIADSLKRAPHAMARYYRKGTAMGLGDLLRKFDCQHVPSVLFDYARYSKSWKGAGADEIAAALETDEELMRLPQVVHVATGAAFSQEIELAIDEERCIVARAFNTGNYNDANEVVWMAVEIASKLEVSKELAHEWHERLTLLGRQSGFARVQTWLISREGFAPDACELLAERNAFSSSQHQLELLSACIDDSKVPAAESRPVKEFEMVVPMGDDNELIVAHTAEQIARQLNFPPSAINQIKHAVVEACINASEHSLSPEQKIYQRFRVEDDKLVITISSRGIVPARSEETRGQRSPSETIEQGALANRRGWGLGIIKTLMDEAEFERVDDGTSLRMTKYRRAGG